MIQKAVAADPSRATSSTVSPGPISSWAAMPMRWSRWRRRRCWSGRSHRHRPSGRCLLMNDASWRHGSSGTAPFVQTTETDRKRILRKLEVGAGRGDGRRRLDGRSSRSRPPRMTTEAILEPAPAKLNLCLHVTAAVWTAIISWTVWWFSPMWLTASLRPGARSVTGGAGPEGAGLQAEPDNLVLRAARAMGVADAALVLDKHHPVASGNAAGLPTRRRRFGAAPADWTGAARGKRGPSAWCRCSGLPGGTSGADGGDRREGCAPSGFAAIATVLVNPACRSRRRRSSRP